MRFLIHMESVFHTIAFGVTIEVLFHLKHLVTMALNVVTGSALRVVPFTVFWCQANRGGHVLKSPTPRIRYKCCHHKTDNSNM